MENNEMMSLEDSGQLRDKMRFFEQELLKNHHIDPNLYVEYNVKRGLRDSAGKGVLTGLTEISDVNGYNLINGRQIPADGRLYYQGINVQDIISGLNGRRFGFEETIYLLIFGKLPDKEELSRFLDMMSDMEELGGRFVRDVVMKGTNANIMNAMQRCVLALYTYDDNPEDISPENVLRQSLELIAKLLKLPYILTMHIAISERMIPYLSVIRRRGFLLPRTFFLCFARMENTQNWKQKFWILH